MPRDRTFAEWQQEQQRLQKGPKGGRASTISPGFGALGPGPRPPAPKNSQVGSNIGAPNPTDSKYNVPLSAPPNYIDDVDMQTNWFSPFQPIWPYGPPQVTNVREFDYPVGYNLNYVQPRMDQMAMFRGLRASWGPLATIIETRKDQLLRIPYTIQRRDKPKASSRQVDEMRSFFKKPDQKLRYSQWSRKLLDDLLVIDAPTIYFARDRMGRPLAAEVLDGATIFPLIDDAGRRPDTVTELDENGMSYLKRQPAFQQIIKGLPMIDLDESEIMYTPMRLRPDFPVFGYPGTEQILIEASEAVRKTLYQLNFWAEGTIPDLIVTVPDTWTPRQIAMFQAHNDALLSGNINLKSKMRFLPGGTKPFDIKNSSGESLWSQRDETLIRLACYAYSVSPTPFVKQTNRSVAQNAQQTAEEEGLYPLMSYWKDDIMDPIIQEKFGYDDVEFVFLPRPEPDQEKQSKIHQVYVRDGIYSINDVLEELGKEPIGPMGDARLIYTGAGAIPLEAAVKGEAAMPGAPISEGKPGLSHSSSSDGNTLGSRPMRGGAVPNNASTQPKPKANVQKFADLLATELSKATKSEVRAAAADATGDIENLPHKVLHEGNYRKGHIWINGLNVSIENAKGSRRGEKDEKGIKWQVKMPAAYGYIRGTIGADGDQVDCYIGKHPKSDTVWVIDQNVVSKKGKVKGFDEHKCMLGYKKLHRALADWHASHFGNDGHDRFADVVELSMDEFKRWLKEGDTTKPIAGQGFGNKVENILKSDTISSSTGLNHYSQIPAKKRRKRKRLRQGPRWLELNAVA